MDKNEQYVVAVVDDGDSPDLVVEFDDIGKAMERYLKLHASGHQKVMLARVMMCGYDIQSA